MAIINWTIPVSSLIHNLQRNEYRIYAINNGEERIEIDASISIIKARKLAVEEITSVDDSVLFLRKNRKTYFISFVLGNEPSELAADYTDDADLERVIDEHIERWEGRKCPTK